MRRFINEDGPKLQFTEAWVPGSDASAAYDIGGAQYLLLALSYKRLVLPLVVRAELALFVLELDELLQLDMGRVVRYLLVERKEGDGRIEGLARLCAEPHNLQPGGVYLLGQLVDGNIGRRADKDLSRVHFREMIDDGRGSYRLSRPRRALNEAERLLEDALNGIHLRMVKFRETRC